MKIINVYGREILDSRGNPTVECELTIEGDIKAVASIPSGASTGSLEALELRDKDPKRYHGKGVLKAVNNINTIIKDNIINKDFDQKSLDRLLNKIDGTKNKSSLGANAILAVSLAFLKACALSKGKELYRYVAESKVSMPIPMMNIINGGKHASNNLEIQEFMIVPMVKTFKERLRLGSEVFHTLKNILSEKGYSVAVGDEGGFAPDFKNTEEALDFIMEAIKKSNYIPGKDVYIALDVAASEYYNQETQMYTMNGKELNTRELTNYYLELIDKYPIYSIEDPFFESDFKSLARFTELTNNRILIVGDDHFVTNKELLFKGIKANAANAILLKANQIGSVTEMLETIELARDNDYKMIISHRSGETEDTFIADLAVGLDIPFIKSGSLSRMERISKYNRLLRIEEQLTKAK